MKPRKEWPNTIPHDLKRMLEQLEMRRDPPQNSDPWAVIQEWLQKNGVQPPERLPQARERRIEAP